MRKSSESIDRGGKEKKKKSISLLAPRFSHSSVLTSASGVMIHLRLCVEVWKSILEFGDAGTFFFLLSNARCRGHCFFFLLLRLSDRVVSSLFFVLPCVFWMRVFERGLERPTVILQGCWKNKNALAESSRDASARSRVKKRVLKNSGNHFSKKKKNRRTTLLDG